MWDHSIKKRKKTTITALQANWDYPYITQWADRYWCTTTTNTRRIEIQKTLEQIQETQDKESECYTPHWMEWRHNVISLVWFGSMSTLRLLRIESMLLHTRVAVRVEGDPSSWVIAGDPPRACSNLSELSDSGAEKLDTESSKLWDPLSAWL